MYIFNSSLLKLIPKSKKIFDMDYFISLAKKNQKILKTFSIKKNQWFDVGRWNDFKETLDMIK